VLTVNTGGTGIYGNSNLTFNGTTLTVNATENMCNNAISNVNSVNMSYLAPFTPTSVGNCVLWLDGSDTTTMTLTGSNLTTWKDKSSNNYSASNFGTPVYAANVQNSRGVVQFGTSGYGVTIPSFVISPQMSVFMVQYPLGSVSGPTIEQSSNSALYPGFLVESGISNFLIRTSIPPPSGLTFAQGGAGMVGGWTAYTGASSYTYTVYSNSIYSYTGGTAVSGATGSPTSNTFTLSSPVAGTYYYYTLNVTTAYGTSTLATSPIAQYVAAPAVSITNYTSTATVAGTSFYYFKTTGSTSTALTNSGTTISMFVLAGGGGGADYVGGGGGAGGLVQLTSNLPSGSYTAIVGAGGNAFSGRGNGSNGSNSVFSNSTSALATAIGGGGGGGGQAAPAPGLAGGSGGGGGGQVSTAAGGSNTAGQGNIGGSSVGGANIAAGGGGVGGAGCNSAASNGGAGGIGITYSDGNQYGGGGGGGGNTPAAPATYGGGSGGTGGDPNSVAGTPNTGGGGGGGWTGGGKAGGSGVIILSYYSLPTSSPASPTLTITTGTANMSWTAASGATSYTWTLYNNGSNTSTYTGALVTGSNGTVSAPTVTASASGLTIGSNYYYTVSASNATGVSPVVASPIVEYFPNPYNLALAVTSSNATLSWSSTGTSPTFYYVLYQTTAYSYTSGTITTIATSNTTAMSATATFTSVAGNYYYFSIYEVTSVGTSPVYLSPIVGYVTPPTISYVASNAVVTQLKDYTSTAIPFYYPRGIIQLSNGNIVVTDEANQRIRLITTGGVVSTLAGSGTVGSNDGTGTGASFSYPMGLALLSNGKIAVADYSNCRIRLLDPSTGVVTTLAGSGTPAFADGTGAAASFNLPNTVLQLSNGNIAVGDTGNNRIRLISTSTYASNSGVVTTLAGSGSPAFADGTGASASFNGPYGLTQLSNGNIAVGDTGNNRIRLISTSTYASNSGVVTTLAGSGGVGSNDGGGGGASFNGPCGLTMIPSNGLLVVGDANNNRIRVVDPSSGAVTTLAGSGNAAVTDGTGTAAAFNLPLDCAVLSNGNILVSDFLGSRVRVITFPSLASPTSLTLSITSGTATLGWASAAGATNYNWVLYSSTTSNYNGTSNSSGTTTSNAPSSAPTGLSSGKFWYFTVASSNTSGVSSAAASSIVSY
jgi:hypothetical protein